MSITGPAIVVNNNPQPALIAAHTNINIVTTFVGSVNHYRPNSTLRILRRIMRMVLFTSRW